MRYLSFREINEYLSFSYLPSKSLPEWLNDCMSVENIGNQYDSLEVAVKFDQVFDKLVSQCAGKRNIIPLSGGWDSRAILGALIERLETSQIETITFGVPGHLDYDIGRKVAKWAGIKSHAIDLEKIAFNWETILESVKKTPWTYVPDSFFNELAIKAIVTKGDAVWSGFLGDPLTGSHLSSICLENHKQAQKFISGQNRCKSIQLRHPKFTVSDTLEPIVNGTDLHFDDALDLGIRQRLCIAPIVLLGNSWSSWNAKIGENTNAVNVVAPFADRSWAGYWLSAPRDKRKGQELYLRFLHHKFPDLFALPDKTSLGLPADARIRLWLQKKHHGLRRRIQKTAPWAHFRTSIMRNYLDYDEMFRKRIDYRDTLRAGFDFLKSNDIVPWINLDKLWNEHMGRRRELGEEFLVLLGLAANIEANLSSK